MAGGGLPEGLTALVGRQLAVGRAHAAARPRGLPSIELPMLVHAGVTGSADGAEAVAAACTAVYLGADVLDDVADDDLGDRWPGVPPAQLTLAAALLVSAMPALALRAGGLDSAPRAGVLDVLADGLLVMSGGQYDDLTAAATGLAACRSVAERKAGAEIGAFAAAGAVAAGAPAEAVGHYQRFGRDLGTALTLGADIADLWQPGGSPDLANGTPTLPVVHGLSRPDGARLQTLLTRARTAPETAGEVRRLLQASGSIAFTALVLETYLRRALRSLALAGPREPAATALAALVRATSLLSAERTDDA